MKLLILFVFVFNWIHNGQCLTLWDWQDRQRRQRIERNPEKRHLLDNSEAKEEANEIPDEDDSVPTLNVSSKDSPYALIDRFFPERENTSPAIKDSSRENLGNLSPSEVWLSDGDLLVLKGGATPNRKGFDNPWTPLDDYVAPYREPKLPPPDFIPSDTGVGVSLPPENEVTTPPPTPATPPQVLPPSRNFVRDFLFDEEKFIFEMENFHSKRRDHDFFVPKLTINLFESPDNQLTTPLPTPNFSKAGPGGYFVSTSTPSSFAYAYQHENEDNLARSTTTPGTTTTTTATTTTTSQKPPSTIIVRELKPRAPKAFYTKPSKTLLPKKFYGQKVDHNEIDTEHKIEERQDLPPNNNGPPFYAPRPKPRPNIFRPRIFANGPTLASTVISSLKPRLYFNPRHYFHHPRRVVLPTPSTRRIGISNNSPPNPPAASNSGGGDHRYVSFYRGQIGGPSWGYSYHL